MGRECLISIPASRDDMPNPAKVLAHRRGENRCFSYEVYMHRDHSPHLQLVARKCKMRARREMGQLRHVRYRRLARWDQGPDVVMFFQTGGRTATVGKADVVERDKC